MQFLGLFALFWVSLSHNLHHPPFNMFHVWVQTFLCEIIGPILSDQSRYNLVYLTFILHGIGTLMPWNMFITAKGVGLIAFLWIVDSWMITMPFHLQYFVDYKLSTGYTGVESVYGDNFLAYLGFAAQVPNVVFNWLNIFIQIGWASLHLLLKCTSIQRIQKSFHLTISVFFSLLQWKSEFENHRWYSGWSSDVHRNSCVGHVGYVHLAGRFFLDNNGHRRYSQQ